GPKACRMGIATSAKGTAANMLTLSIFGDENIRRRAGSRSARRTVILNSSKRRYSTAFARFPVPRGRRPAMRPRMTPHGNFGWGAARNDVKAPHIENRRFGWGESAPRSTERSHPPRFHAAGISLSVLASFIRRGSALRLSRVRAHGDFVANHLP